MTKQQTGEGTMPDELEPVNAVTHELAHDDSPDEAIRVAEIDNRERTAEAAQAEATARMFGAADINYVVEHFQARLYNYMYHMIGNREQAADLTQDVWAKVWKAFDNGTEIHEYALASWLYRIAGNTATDALRSKWPITCVPLSAFNDDLPLGAMHGDNTFDDSLARDAGRRAVGGPIGDSLSDHNSSQFAQRIADCDVIDAALARMNSKYVVPLLLYCRDGFTTAEIGEMLGMSLINVRTVIMRARERFRTLYHEELTSTSPARTAPPSEGNRASTSAPEKPLVQPGNTPEPAQRATGE